MTNSSRSLFISLVNDNFLPYINRLFELRIVDIIIGFFRVSSVILNIIELSIPQNSSYLFICNIATNILTILFVIELTIRFLVAPDKKLYFKEYWLDILAILPLLRVFRLELYDYYACYEYSDSLVY